MAVNCKFNITNANYRKVNAEVKEALGKDYKYDIFRSIADTFSGDINSLTAEYVLERYPRTTIEEETASPAEEAEPIIKVYDGLWSRDKVTKPENQDKLFIFTDNTDRNSGKGLIRDDSKYAKKYGKGKHYPSTTSAVIRGLDNAFPVSTQRYFHLGAKRESGRWTNNDIDEFKKVIRDEFDTIIEEWNTGNYTTIVLPNRGLLTETEITGLNDKERTLIKAALEEELKRLYDAVGAVYTDDISTQQKSKEAKQKEAQHEARLTAKKENANAAKWARFAGDEDNLEVSTAGDDFGKQFSALNAVFAEGTKITIRIGGKKSGKQQTFDIGGYSVEAAYQMIKGYTRNPKGPLTTKEGKPMRVQGKDKAPISELLYVETDRRTQASKQAVEDYTYMHAYLPLWKTWAKQNKDKIKELKKKAKGKILTDRFAKTRVSQARALSEILWGAPKIARSKAVQDRYDIQRENAVTASKEVMREVKKIKKMKGIRIVERKPDDDIQISYLAQGLNEQGRPWANGKEKILSFSLSDDIMDPSLKLFINPFEGQRDAVKKYIQWLMPNDYDSLPDELRVEYERRDTIRRYLSKGGYTQTEIIASNTQDSIIYARTLRYLIENFQELRQKYNPLDIQEFGHIRHRVRVTADNSVKEAADNLAMRFSLEESIQNDEILDDNNSFKLERVVDNEGKATDNYIITFPKGQHNYTNTQKERLFKTIAMAIPEGSTVTIDPDYADEQLVKDYKQIVSRGFTKIAEKEITLRDGSSIDVGVYRRNTFRKQAVTTEKELFTLDDIKRRGPKDPSLIFMYETDGAYADTMLTDPNLPIIPIITAHNSRYNNSSYYRDDEFEYFKKEVDDAMKMARNFIDQGKNIILPSGYIGSGKAALQHYAPKCYQYLQEQLSALKDYGNHYFLDNEYLKERSTTVDEVEKAPSENFNLDANVLQSPRARLRQRFTDQNLLDLAELFAEEFLDVLNLRRNSLLKELREELNNEEDEKKSTRLQRKLNKLEDYERWQIEVLKEVGVDALLQDMADTVEDQIDLMDEYSEAGAQRIRDAHQKEFRELIFRYAIPIIEDEAGLRIKGYQNAEITKEQNTKNDNAEDTDGQDTPEMGWSYNYRLVDAYKSLSKEVRKIISNIYMRDPNNPNGYLYNTVGTVKKWDSQYIYACIMSRMSQLSLGEAKNFMTITPVEKLSEIDRENYPLGKPVFPILESMRSRYSWANDLIDDLTVYYKKTAVRDAVKGTRSGVDVENDTAAMSVLGNVCSQFYANFCEQFIPYCTMVDGKIIYENQANGAASLKQTTITNYEGNVRFADVDMIYNNDGSANTDNIQKNINKLLDIKRTLVYDPNHPEVSKKFWDEIKKLKKENDDNVIKAFNGVSDYTFNILNGITDTLKACGIVFSEYDIFSIAAENKNPGLTQMLDELQTSLEALLGLPENEHIFESSYKITRISELNKTVSNKSFNTPQYNWNKFFEKFGDYVSEREYTSSARILGKSRYSYLFPSFMSMTVSALTNPDIEARRQFIRENFMPYEWFCDQTTVNDDTPKFKNEILALAWSGATGIEDRAGRELFALGHDMICKKDNGVEKEYSEWTPQDIMELMFRELTQPTNKQAGCFIIPTLSDSPVCKAIQMPKMDVFESRKVMLGVVKQELERMRLVEKRRIILQMQNIIEKKNNKEELSESEEKYYEDNLSFYNKYKEKHPEQLQEIENYDKNGLNFCFFPELENAEQDISIDRARKEGNDFMYKVIQLLSKDYNNPSTKRVKLKTVLQKLHNLSDERYDNLASYLGLVKTVEREVVVGSKPKLNWVDRKVTASDEQWEAWRNDPRYHVGTVYENGEGYLEEGVPVVDDAGQPVMEEEKAFRNVTEVLTKEECINMLIEQALNSVMSEKVAEFYLGDTHKRGQLRDINPILLQSVLKADDDLMRRYNELPQESEHTVLSKKEEEEINNFYTAVYRAVERFYWNHTAAMSQFLQIMITDTAYYKDPSTFGGSVDFAKRWKQVYGAGMRMNTNSKFGKQYERSIILADRKRRSHSYNVLEGVLQKAVDDGRIVEEEKDALLYKFKGIMGTDAQAMRSLTSYRDVMDMVGQSTVDLARAIENLRTNKWDMNDFYTVLNTLKPFTFGAEDQDSGIDDVHLRTMVQHKNSEMVLLAIYNTLVGSQVNDANYSARLRGINRAMEEIKLLDENGNVMRYKNSKDKESCEEMKAIDVVQYHSAVKVGAHGVIDINFSRDALKKVQEEGKLKVGELEISIGAHESYYSIEKRLGKLLDSKKIKFEDYEEAMDVFEPSEEEVFEIIRSSIYKNGDESLGYDNQVLHKMPYKYYCIQQPTPDHYTDNDKATFGSQPRHIIMSDLPENLEVKLNGKTYNREQIRDRYNSLIVANLIDCYVNDIEPLFTNTGSDEPAIKRLQRKLLEMIDGNSKYDGLRDALELVPDGNGGLTFALPLNNISVSQQLEELMTSMFKNAIHKQKINGGNAILAADVGYSNKLKVLGKRDKEGKITSVTGIECLLPAHMKKMFEPYLEKKTDKDGNVILDSAGKPVMILDPKKLKEAGLDKAIGYRIPTEGLYSIMPLIIKGFLPQQSGSSIVVAQEVTTLTGSDNDVDKMFLMLKAVNKDLEAIHTPSSMGELHPLEMSKEQRDNEIIDIFYKITTNPQMSTRWLHPGHFDNITMNSQRLTILKDRNLRQQFMQRAGLSTSGQLLTALTKELSKEQYNELYCRVMGINREDLDGDKDIYDIMEDFTNQFSKPLAPCYPSTFIEMHQTYMAGVAEKGIFANNSLDHAKLQWADVRLAPNCTFMFEGYEVEKVDPRTVPVKKGGKTYQHFITDDCAECSAAAVDNGKKPVLKGLNSNTRTASFFGFLTRLGLGIEGAGLLLAQPQIDYNIRIYGTVNAKKSLEREIRKLGKWLEEHNRDTNSDELNWRLHNFTKHELYQNLVIENYNDLFTQGDTKEAVDRISSLFRVYNLMLTLLDINYAMKEPHNILHYDSPNHAADSSMGGVVAQTKAVESVNNRSAEDAGAYLENESQLLVYNIEEKAKEKNKLSGLKALSSRYRLYGALMDSQMPITQAFYTLGIEKIRTQFAPYFSFGRDEMQQLTDRIWNKMDKLYIRRAERRAEIVGQMYRDWVVYNMSKTELFGNDSEMTFDQKRQYYLYDYPAKFLQLKAQLPILNEIDAIRRLSVRHGMIILDRGGNTTQTLRNFIRDSFDTLIQHPDPAVQQVAKDLFLYTYYLNGGEFSYMSFGNFMSPEFQRAFPEYIQALRAMNSNPITEKDTDNFFEQFLVKRAKLGLLRQITYKDSRLKAEGLQKGFHDTGNPPEYYGGWDNIDEYTINVTVSNGNTKYELLRLDKQLSEIYGTVIYVPVRMNTSMHYNANQTMDEIAETVYDQDKINANRRIGRKKKNGTVISYDTYQSTKGVTETPTDRETNVPEVPDTADVSAAMLTNDSEDSLPDNKVSSSMLQDDESAEMDYDAIEQGVGMSSILQEDDVDLDEYDRALNSHPSAVRALQDSDVEEAQKIIERDNDKILCLKKG